MTHSTRGWCAGAHGQVQTYGSGPVVPVGTQLTREFTWQVGADSPGSWWDVEPDWEDSMFNGVSNHVPRLHLSLTWWMARHQKMKEWYIVDFASRTWIPQENCVSGKRRPMRVVQVLNIIGAYEPQPPPPPLPTAAAVSVVDSPVPVVT